MITLSVGNFLFSFGGVFATQAYLQFHNSGYIGIFVDVGWWNKFHLNFPSLNPAEMSLFVACTLFATSAIVHEINLLTFIFRQPDKD